MNINRTPAQNLAIIARQYMNDQRALTHARQTAESRRASIPGIQAILQPFIDGKTSLETMRHQLDTYLRKPENDTWGTTGFWMMTLNQLANYHGETGAEKLRQTL